MLTCHGHHVPLGGAFHKRCTLDPYLRSYTAGCRFCCWLHVIEHFPAHTFKIRVQWKTVNESAQKVKQKKNEYRIFSLQRHVVGVTMRFNSRVAWKHIGFELDSCFRFGLFSVFTLRPQRCTNRNEQSRWATPIVHVPHPPAAPSAACFA